MVNKITQGQLSLFFVLPLSLANTPSFFRREAIAAKFRVKLNQWISVPHSFSISFLLPILLFPAFLFPAFLFPAALQAREVPNLTSPVLDEARLLSSEDRVLLENSLRRLYESGGSQIAVLTIPSLEGEDINEYSIKVVEKWKLGKAKEDNGLLLLIANQERKIRIEVGQGLEGLLTDLQSKRIIDGVMTPSFRAGNPSAGIVAGVRAIIHTTDPSSSVLSADSFVPPSPSRRTGKSSPISFLVMLIVFMIVAVFGRSSRGYGRHYGGWGGSSHGSSRRGGFSGGGGGFSGGGASGGW